MYRNRSAAPGTGPPTTIFHGKLDASDGGGTACKKRSFPRYRNPNASPSNGTISKMLCGATSSSVDDVVTNTPHTSRVSVRKSFKPTRSTCVSVPSPHRICPILVSLFNNRCTTNRAFRVRCTVPSATLPPLLVPMILLLLLLPLLLPLLLLMPLVATPRRNDVVASSVASACFTSAIRRRWYSNFFSRSSNRNPSFQ